jgi:ABC-type branched-subunit amino acid transport system substrate-binding protein
MKNRTFVGKITVLGLAVFMVMSLSLLVCNSQAYAASKKTVTIGIMSCISGAQAVIGNTYLYGAQQAVQYVNKEQLLGKDVELKAIVIDDQLNATVGLNAYQRVKDKILTFTGYDTSGCAALRPFVEQDKKPFVACTTNRTFIYPPSKYVFGVATPYEELLVGFLKAVKSNWKEKRAPRLGLISFDIPSGRVAVNAAKKYGPDIGWEIGPISIVPLTSVDFSEAIARIKAKKPDWVLLSLTGGQIKGVLTQAETSGVKGMTKWLLPLWGGFTESTTMVVPKEQLEGVNGFCMISNPDVHEGAKKWAAWTKANGGKPSDESGNSGAVGVFILTRAIQLALEKVSLDDLDGAKLSEYGFQRIKDFQMFGDLMQPITYGPNRSRGNTKASILKMVNGKAKEAITWFELPSLAESK